MQKRRSGFWCLCGLMFLLFNAAAAQSAEEPSRVLFVGNSYTYFWNLPQSVQSMAASRNIDLVARQSTAGGSNWAEHLRGEKDLKSRTLIAEGDWDFVVMQNHSMSTIERQDSFMLFGEKMAALIRESGAAPLLYITWARDFNPLMQEKITAKYRQLAESTDATLVPVGPSWEKARSLRPELELFHPDGSHPSPLGTYLTACVFFRVLTQQAAEGLPHRLITTDADGEQLYLNIVSPEDAVFLQQVADQVVRSFEE